MHPGEFRFLPASFEAFQRTARDIRSAYSVNVDQSQDLLAKVYGYQSCSELMAHLGSSPTRGPFLSERDYVQQIATRITAGTKFVQAAGHLVPTGRLTADNLGLFESPEGRESLMDFHSAVDDIVLGRDRPEPNCPTSDYVGFEEKDIAKGFSDRTHREGIFRLTRKGQCIHDAFEWIFSQKGDGDSDTNVMTAISRIRNRYPNNPYPESRWFWQEVVKNDNNPEIHTRVTQELWGSAKRCRSLFESILPPGFKGVIEPKLVGNGAANETYFAVLYWGATCAAQLGHTREALAWARRSLRFNQRDSFGARFLVDELRDISN